MSEASEFFYNSVVDRIAFLIDIPRELAKVHADWEAELINSMMRQGFGHLATADAVIDAQCAKGKEALAEMNIDINEHICD